MNEKSLKIAVVGSGVAGLTAAYILQRQHEVTFFEKNGYVGGHTHTIVIDNGPDKGTPVDTGFIVLNDRTYPTFKNFLNQLNVPVRNSDMSFSYYDEKTGLQYAGTNINGLFAKRSNIWRPSFYQMLWDITRFNREVLRDLKMDKLNDTTLGMYLADGNYSKEFIQDYVIPIGAAIWSTSLMEMMDFPAATLGRFFHNQGLFHFKNRPQWQTVEGGSHSYVKAFLKIFKGKILLNSPVEQIKRKPDRVMIQTRDNQEHFFDKVILASHADESLGFLADPSEEEQRLLSPWKYQKNNTVLHTDTDVMPPLKRAWASWNYIREKETTKIQPVSVTYHMNRLQGLTTRTDYFVTLNRMRPIPEKYILKEFFYMHPTYTQDAIATQKELPKLNGVNNTYFCGSYFGYGLHEDAVKSGVAVAQCFGLDL